MTVWQKQMELLELRDKYMKKHGRIPEHLLLLSIDKTIEQVSGSRCVMVTGRFACGSVIFDLWFDSCSWTKRPHPQLTKRYRFPASLLGRWVMLLGVQPPIKKTVPIRELVGAEGQHMFMRALHTDGELLHATS